MRLFLLGVGLFEWGLAAHLWLGLPPTQLLMAAGVAVALIGFVVTCFTLSGLRRYASGATRSDPCTVPLDADAIRKFKRQLRSRPWALRTFSREPNLQCQLPGVTGRESEIAELLVMRALSLESEGQVGLARTHVIQSRREMPVTVATRRKSDGSFVEIAFRAEWVGSHLQVFSYSKVWGRASGAAFFALSPLFGPFSFFHSVTSDYEEELENGRGGDAETTSLWLVSAEHAASHLVHGGPDAYRDELETMRDLLRRAVDRAQDAYLGADPEVWDTRTPAPASPAGTPPSGGTAGKGGSATPGTRRSGPAGPTPPGSASKGTTRSHPFDLDTDFDW